MKIFDQYRGLPKEIYILFLATVVNRLGDFIYPFLTLFLKTKIGLSVDKIGTILVISTVMYIIAMGIGGKLADHFSRKKVYSYCTLISIICMAICGFMKEGYAMVGVLIFSEIFIHMATPPMDAMKIDLVETEKRQSAFSLIYLGINLGVAVGHLVAGALFADYMRLLFFGDALTSLIALGLIVRFVKEKDRNKEIEKQKKEGRNALEAAQEGSLFNVLLKRPKLIVFCIICGVLSYVYSQGNFILPLHLEAIYDVKKGSYYLGALMALNGLTVILLTPFMMTLTGKNKALTNVALAGLGYGSGFLLFGVWESLVGFTIGMILWTIGEIIYSINANVYIANHAPITHRGRFQSIYTILKTVGRALAPYLAGLYLVGHELVSGWYMAAGISILCVIVIAVLFKWMTSDEISGTNERSA